MSRLLNLLFVFGIIHFFLTGYILMFVKKSLISPHEHYKKSVL